MNCEFMFCTTALDVVDGLSVTNRSGIFLTMIEIRAEIIRIGREITTFKSTPNTYHVDSAAIYEL